MTSTPTTKTDGRTPISVHASATIAAPADVVYDLISDITRMPEFSPENIRGEWLGAATGPAVGARFKGTNRLGSTTWSTKPTVTAADRGRRFAFKVPGASGALWTYDLIADGDTTTVTESMTQAKPSSFAIRWFQRRAGVTDRAASLEAAMATTLERVAAVAERQSAAA
jgi:hypothetical protein